MEDLCLSAFQINDFEEMEVKEQQRQEELLIYDVDPTIRKAAGRVRGLGRKMLDHRAEGQCLSQGYLSGGFPTGRNQYHAVLSLSLGMAQGTVDLV